MPRKTLKKIVIPAGDGWKFITSKKAYIQAVSTEIPFAWAPAESDLATLTESDCHILRYPDDTVINPAGSSMWVKRAQAKEYILTITEESI